MVSSITPMCVAGSPTPEPLPAFEVSLLPPEDGNTPGGFQHSPCDQIRVLQAYVARDSLHLVVTLRGGCASHELRVIRDLTGASDEGFLRRLHITDPHPVDPCSRLQLFTIGMPIESLLRDWPRPRDKRTPVQVAFWYGDLPPATLLPRGLPDADMESDAALAALELSGELFPPRDLYASIRDDLHRIWREYGEQYSELLTVRMLDADTPRQITLEVDEPTRELIRKRRYHAWDEINAKAMVYRVESELNYPKRGVRLWFARPFVHRRRLADLYVGLPGIEQAIESSRIGDSSWIRPLLWAEGRAYLFRLGWGDCPAGCISQAFFYFRVVAGEISMDGPWPSGSADRSNPPQWWREMRERHGLDERGHPKQ